MGFRMIGRYRGGDQRGGPPDESRGQGCVGGVPAEVFQPSSTCRSGDTEIAVGNSTLYQKTTSTFVGGHPLTVTEQGEGADDVPCRSVKTPLKKTTICSGTARAKFPSTRTE